MPYKKYIKRDGKLYGPYIYHSRKEGGRVITDYHGKAIGHTQPLRIGIAKEREKKSRLRMEKKYLPVGIFLALFLFALIGFSFFNFENFSLGSITGLTTLNDFEDQQIEFSDPLAIIRFVIEIISAEHLDENREFISDIYEETKELDDVWSETISDGEFVRVTFEENLTSENDITIYPRVISGDPRIEVYEKAGGHPLSITPDEKIAEFLNIVSEEYNKILLTKLRGKQDTFDLRVIGGSLEFDYILDPAEIMDDGGRV